MLVNIKNISQCTVKSKPNRHYPHIKKRAQSKFTRKGNRFNSFKKKKNNNTDNDSINNNLNNENSYELNNDIDNISSDNIDRDVDIDNDYDSSNNIDECIALDINNNQDSDPDNCIEADNNDNDYNVTFNVKSNETHNKKHLFVTQINVHMCPMMILNWIQKKIDQKRILISIYLVFTF
jgi:hypothetical protein